MKSKYAGGKHHLINSHEETRFKEQWGITAYDLSRVEGVTPDAIHMRVMLYGTPFQRRKKETMWETKYGKPLGQLALERGIHPGTIHVRHRVYKSLDLPPTARERADLRDISWTEDPQYKRCMQSTFFTLEWALAELERINWTTR
jgi:hypothetical protein